MPSSLLGRDRAHDLQDGTVRIRDDNRTSEPHAVLHDGTRIAYPVGHHSDYDGHGVHAVGDHVRQPDRRGRSLVPVDGVEVAGRAGVPDEVGALHPKALRRERVADLSVRSRGHDAAASASAVPRATRVEYALTTGSPSSVATSARVVIMSLPAADRMVSTTIVVASRSPARTGLV